jgi:hypothetical protein
MGDFSRNRHYISLDRCFVQLETSESATKVVDGHDISIEIIPDGAVVGVDALRFFKNSAAGPRRLRHEDLAPGGDASKAA